MSNHHALLFNRRKGKLSSEQKSVTDGKLKQVQQIFSLSTEVDGSGLETDKGKKIETGDEGSGDEMKNLHNSSVSKAADMAVGYVSIEAFIYLDYPWCCTCFSTLGVLVVLFKLALTCLITGTKQLIFLFFI